MKTLADSRLWNARSSYGTEALFADAALLWKAACEYFEWCDDHPLIDRVTGKDGKVIERELIRAFTMEGLCNFLKCSRKYFDVFKNHCEDKNILEMIAYIEDVITRQKLEAAAAGLLNATIITKDLWFMDKEKEVNNISPTIIDWSDSDKADTETKGSSEDSSKS